MQFYLILNLIENLKIKQENFQIFDIQDSRNINTKKILIF